MLSLHLNPVNVSLPAHFHSTSSSLIGLVFLNDTIKVLLYDQISASCFSNHDLFLTYNLSSSNTNSGKCSSAIWQFCCVVVKTKLVKAKDRPWFNADIKALIDKRDIVYQPWKRFRTDDLKAVHKSACSEVTRHIKIEKTLFWQKARFL